MVPGRPKNISLLRSGAELKRNFYQATTLRRVSRDKCLRNKYFLICEILNANFVNKKVKIPNFSRIFRDALNLCHPKDVRTCYYGLLASLYAIPAYLFILHSNYQFESVQKVLIRQEREGVAKRHLFVSFQNPFIFCITEGGGKGQS